MIATEFTRQFGVPHPILCGGMTGYGTAPLIGAVANSERDTQLIFRSFHNTARVAKNSISEQIAEISARAGATFADVADLASGVRGRERVLADGDVEGGVWWAGQTQGLIDEVASCREVIDTILAEAEQIIGSRLPSYLS